MKKLLLGCCLIFSVNAEIIKDIKYTGTQRIDKETVASYLPVAVGDDVDDYAVNEALKSLHETGLFEEVSVKLNAGILYVDTKEYPIVNKIYFEGNSKIKEADILKASGLKSGEVLSPAKLKEVQQGLLDLYRRFGKYNATVTPKISKLDGNRVNLAFEIHEDESVKINNIRFVGNNAFSAGDLRDVMASKINRWYRILVNDDIYSQERMMEDKSRIERFYKESGYIDAKVVSAVGELSKDKKGVTLTFTVVEGDVYKFGDIKVTSKVPGLETKEIENRFHSRKGDLYNATLLEVDLMELIVKSGRKGFAALDVEPKITRDPAKKTVNIEYVITQGKKIYISKIVVRGNSRTRDHIIRREIPFEEGDALNKSLVKMAEDNIRDTGFFEKVAIEVVPDPTAQDKCAIDVSVDEAPTGEISANMSYSTQDKLGLEVSYSERNFFGTGRSLSVTLGSGKTRTGTSYSVDRTSGKRSSINRKNNFRFLKTVVINVGDEHLFDTDIAGNLGFFKYTTGRWDAFNIDQLGASFGINYDITRNLAQAWEYSYTRRKVEDVADSASPIILSQIMKVPNKPDGDVKSLTRGKANLSSLKHTISYSDYILTGLKGSYRVGLTTTIGGIGGDANFLKNELFGSYTIPSISRSKLVLSASAGLLSKFGSKKPAIYDSFSLGDESFRGFEDCGIGPMAETTRKFVTAGGKHSIGNTRVDYIGAKKFWKGTVEYVFPIGLPEELQFRGSVFTDFGMLWDPPQKAEKYINSKLNTDDNIKNANTAQPICDIDSSIVRSKIIDRKKLKMSVGISISFVTPVGPIKLSYAIPVKKEKHDEQQRFLIGFSTSF